MIGIDINEKTVKLIEIKEGPQGISLVNAVLEPEPPSAKSIQKIFKANSISDKNVYSVISGKQIVVCPKLFPLMSDKELREALYWEAKDLISFPLEQAAVSFKKTGERLDGGSKKVELLLVVVHKDQLKNTQNLLEEAGLKVKGITVAPFAVWDLMKHKFKPEKDELYAVLDVRTDHSSLNIFKGEELKFVRELSVAGDSAETLSQEVSQTISYVSEKAIVPGVNRLFLIGEISSPKELDKLLGASLGIKVEIFDPLQDIDCKDKPQAKEISSCFGVAMGLALGKAHSLNLLSVNKPKSLENPFAKLPIKKISQYGILVLLVFFMLFWGLAKWNGYKKDLMKTLTLKQAELAAKQQPSAIILEEGKKAQNYLSALRQLLPSSFALEELNYESKNNDVTFVGKLSRQEYVGGLIYKLESSDKFKQVKLWEAQSDGEGVRVKFTVEFKK